MVELPSVTETKSTSIAESSCCTQNVPLRTEIKGDLERHSLEVVLQTSLGKEAKTEVTIVVAIPETGIGANTCKPAKVVNDTTHPLIHGGEVVVAVSNIVNFMGVPTQIQFQTVVGVETMLIGEFSASAATKSTTDTNPILCIHGKGKAENCNQKKHYFLHCV